MNISYFDSLACPLISVSPLPTCPTGLDKGINAEALQQVVAGEPSLVLHLASASVQSILETSSSSSGNAVGSGAQGKAQAFEYGLSALSSRVRASLLEQYSAVTVMHGAFATLYAACAPSDRITKEIDDQSSDEEGESDASSCGSLSRLRFELERASFQPCNSATHDTISLSSCRWSLRSQLCRNERALAGLLFRWRG